MTFKKILSNPGDSQLVILMTINSDYKMAIDAEDTVSLIFPLTNNTQSGEDVRDVVPHFPFTSDGISD